MKLKPQTRLIIGISLIAIAVIAVLIFLIKGSNKEQLPPLFLEARKEASLISQKIVDLTDDVNEKIKAANLSDSNGNKNDALVSIKEARQINTEAYDQAFELSRQLQKLAESLAEIKSQNSQRSAYEAVAVELALVSEFINYTQALNTFLDNLSVAVATDSFANRRAAENYLQEVNKKANLINDLNEEFLVKMSIFD